MAHIGTYYNGLRLGATQGNDANLTAQTQKELMKSQSAGNSFNQSASWGQPSLG